VTPFCLHCGSTEPDHECSVESILDAGVTPVLTYRPFENLVVRDDNPKEDTP